MFASFRQRRKRIALCRAIYERNLQRVQELIDENFDVNFVFGGSSPLTQAVWSGDRRIVDFLMSHGASLAKPGNESALAGAVSSGDHELIDLALAAGHDIHYRPRRTLPPLQVAAFKNRTDTMKYLIARGATKEDFDYEKCRWTSLNSATIRELLDLGVEVPGDIAEYVRAGTWD